MGVGWRRKISYSALNDDGTAFVCKPGAESCNTSAVCLRSVLCPRCDSGDAIYSWIASLHVKPTFVLPPRYPDHIKRSGTATNWLKTSFYSSSSSVFFLKTAVLKKKVIYINNDGEQA